MESHYLSSHSQKTSSCMPGRETRLRFRSFRCGVRVRRDA